MGVLDCPADLPPAHHITAARTAAHRKLIQRRNALYADGLRKRAWNS